MPVVLIVDDDTAFRKRLRNVFDQGGGFDACIEARCGSEAFAKASRQAPGLAILDFALPDMTGLQLAQKLREIIPELRIFILTADYSMKIERNALSWGITAVFSKLDDLASIVANARAICGIE